MKRNVLLSTLWIFLVTNFIYSIVYTLNHAENLKAYISGELGEIILPQGLLTAFSIMVELAMVMILLSRLLKYKLNRILNIILSIIIAVIQTWGLTSGGPLLLKFFVIIEIVTCISIAVLALKWKQE